MMKVISHVEMSNSVSYSARIVRERFFLRYSLNYLDLCRMTRQFFVHTFARTIIQTFVICSVYFT